MVELRGSFVAVSARSSTVMTRPAGRGSAGALADEVASAGFHHASAAGLRDTAVDGGFGGGLSALAGPLARVVAQELRSPSPASTYSGVRVPEGIADALNRTMRR